MNCHPGDEGSKEDDIVVDNNRRSQNIPPVNDDIEVKEAECSCKTDPDIRGLDSVEANSSGSDKMAFREIQGKIIFGHFW